MAENIIEDVERVEIVPSGGDTIEEKEGETPEGESPEGESPKEKLVVHREPEKPTEADFPKREEVPAEVEGETPREKALRLEVERLRAVGKKERNAELLAGEKPTIEKKELPAEKQAVLSKYKPEEISSLREVIPVIAEEMGYVRRDQLTATQYEEKASEELDAFLEKHPEYLPENDKGNVLWNRFKEEHQLFRPPANPKEYAKIFNRIHNTVFGIQPVGNKGSIVAQQRKIQVASHAGASGPARQGVQQRTRPNTSGLRLDMLKGFNEEELAALKEEE